VNFSRSGGRMEGGNLAFDFSKFLLMIKRKLYGD